MTHSYYRNRNINVGNIHVVTYVYRNPDMDTAFGRNVSLAMNLDKIQNTTDTGEKETVETNTILLAISVLTIPKNIIIRIHLNIINLYKSYINQ